MLELRASGTARRRCHLPDGFAPRDREQSDRHAEQPKQEPSPLVPHGNTYIAPARSNGPSYELRTPGDRGAGAEPPGISRGFGGEAPESPESWL
ncbi:hypothetical protein JMUB6875_11570 [Nocardia sp. JMUB6875]